MQGDPIRSRERAKEWRERNPEEVRRQQLWHKFHMLPAQYDKLLIEQHGVCAICNQACITGKRLAVDHSHKSKDKYLTRGLLCMHCNQGLGSFQESAELLQQAIIYLRKYGGGK